MKGDPTGSVSPARAARQSDRKRQCPCDSGSPSARMRGGLRSPGLSPRQTRPPEMEAPPTRRRAPREPDSQPAKDRPSRSMGCSRTFVVARSSPPGSGLVGWAPTPRSAPAPRGAVRKPELEAHKSPPIFGSLGKRPGKPSLEVKLPPPDGARDAWVDAFSHFLRRCYANLTGSRLEGIGPSGLASEDADGTQGHFEL